MKKLKGMNKMNSQKLLEYMDFLKSFNRYNVPDKHYIAWKILILKKNKYDNIHRSFIYEKKD